MDASLIKSAIPSSVLLPLGMVKSLVDPFAVKELPFQVPNAKFSVPVPTVAVALENPPNTSV